MTLHESDLRKNPYSSHIDELMAALSIRNRCYGARLQGVYDFLNDLKFTFPYGSSNSAWSLENKENNTIHPGLRFTSHTITVSQTQLLDPELQCNVLPLIIVARADMGIVLAEMLTRPDLFDKMHWTHEKQYNSMNERVFGSFFTASAWASAQAKIGVSKNVAGILLFSDSTQILHLGNESLHPIYICPAGLEFKDMTFSSMMLVGFIPALASHIKDTLSDSATKQYHFGISSCLLLFTLILLIQFNNTLIEESQSPSRTI